MFYANASKSIPICRWSRLKILLGRDPIVGENVSPGNHFFTNLGDKYAWLDLDVKKTLLQHRSNMPFGIAFIYISVKILTILV